jgi:hypothetical protein
MCIAETRTARVAPKQRAARHEHAPAPAFAVVAPAKRFDATEHDARCVRARYASPTRERDPTNATLANPPAGTREPHRSRPTPPTAPRSSPSRRRAAPFPARASADGSCFSAPRNNRSRPHARRKRRARGPSPPRALRAVDFDTRTAAETRRGRGGALAFARPLPSDTTHAHKTTRV